MRWLGMCLPVVLSACLVPASAGSNDGGAVGDGGLGSRCGGFAGLGCGDGLSCVDLPDDGCDPATGGADCPGVCVAEDGGSGGGSGGGGVGSSCGGFAGLLCGAGLTCVDVPGDGCDPATGGADCPGTCAAVDGGSGWHGIACSGSVCEAGSAICCVRAATATCEASDGGCLPGEGGYLCDGPEDCPSGSCCGYSGRVGTFCGGSSCFAGTSCHSSVDCPVSLPNCCPAGDGYRLCGASACP